MSIRLLTAVSRVGVLACFAACGGIYDDGGASAARAGEGGVPSDPEAGNGGAPSGGGASGGEVGLAGATGVSPAAKGGLMMTFSPTAAAGEACITGSAASVFGVGNPTPASDGSSIGSPIMSGENETDVICTVSKDGSFRATIMAPNISLDLRGTIAGSGSISAFAPAASLSVIGFNCTFDAREPYAYQPGSMHIGFDCPGARNPDYPGIVCNLSGNVVVQRCAE
jgi:hypothetical protein